MSLPIKEMLLIEEPTVQILKDELMNVTSWFVLPGFAIALCLEYFGELKFHEVIKKLILILAFMGVFYTFHKAGVDLSFKASEEILRKVSPHNIFLRSWTEVKVKTADNTSWNILQKFAIPNINDLLGTAFFLLSKVFIWILKLIYSTVYHLTYVFAPLTAILYFFPITRNSISGTIQSSLWCMLMPIVLVSILAIVGNSIQAPAQNGTLSIVSIDQILWLFGVTLILLMSPILTLGILRGGGVAMSGSAIGVMMTNSAMKVLKTAPIVAGGIKSTSKTTGQLASKTLFEPSVRELLKKENANNPSSEKLKLLDQKGGIKNPFKASAGIDDRLSKIGMTKDEARMLSKMPVSSATQTSSRLSTNKSANFKQAYSGQSPETFKYDKSFWNKITPEHREGIRTKYGIAGDTPTPNKLYYPVSPLESVNPRNTFKKVSSMPMSKSPEVKKTFSMFKPNQKLRGRNEV